MAQRRQGTESLVSAWSEASGRPRGLQTLRRDAEELRRKLQMAEAGAPGGCPATPPVMPQLRGQRELRITELRRTLETERQEATAQARRIHLGGGGSAGSREETRAELSGEAAARCCVERENLEAVQERHSTALNEARAEASLAKAECEERQRVLDEMSRELQERKRHGQMMSKEADLAHGRKIRQETEGRELRRKKTALERSLGVKGTAYADEDGAAQRAVQSLSSDLRQAMAQLEELRGHGWMDFSGG
eukprot:Skav208239  [mRNA]  locus=scaffold2601:238556:246183:+ [translate_table: standard]